MLTRRALRWLSHLCSHYLLSSNSWHAWASQQSHFLDFSESQVPASGVSILTPVRMLSVYLSISASQPGVSLLQEAGSFGNVWRHPVTAKSGGANGIWKGEDRETTEGQCSSEVTPYEKAVESHNRPQCCTGKFWCTPYSIQHCWPIVNSVLLTFRLANSVV